MKKAIIVKFLIERDSEDQDDVFAYFPNEKYYGNPDTSNAGYGFDFKMRTSYAHIGQHSACHPDYTKECKPATQEQYKDLKSELESIGYNLKIK